MDYIDFHLKISPLGTDNQYAVSARSLAVGESSGVFAPPLTGEQLELFILKVGLARRGMRRIHSPEWRAAQEFGQKLFRSLFTDDIRAAYLASHNDAVRQGKGLRVKLTLEAPELANYPWEFLYDPSNSQFLSLFEDTPILRYIELPRPVMPLTVSPPLRILAVASSPQDFPQLDLAQERRNLMQALAPLLTSGLIELEWTPTATLEAVRERLLQRPYHIFHFIGHGGFDESAQDGILIFENASRYSNRVSGERLAVILGNHRTLRLAVLNACEGARTSEQDPFAGTAMTLVRTGNLPAVIAMQFEISDTAAINFASGFYAAIGTGRPVDAAVSQGRQAIFTDDNDVEWSTPVLYLRAPDGIIFQVDTSRAAEEARRIAQEQAEQERLAHEKLQAEREAAEQAEIQRLEKIKLELEQIEQERQNKIKQEQTRAEQEQLEQERLKQERIHQEQAEQQRLEQLRVEQERIHQEQAEQQRLEQVRADQERVERERITNEQKERDRLARELTRMERGQKQDGRAIQETQRPPTTLAESALRKPASLSTDGTVNRGLVGALDNLSPIALYGISGISFAVASGLTAAGITALYLTSEEQPRLQFAGILCALLALALGSLGAWVLGKALSRRTRWDRRGTGLMAIGWLAGILLGTFSGVWALDPFATLTLVGLLTTGGIVLGVWSVRRQLSFRVLGIIAGAWLIGFVLQGILAAANTPGIQENLWDWLVPLAETLGHKPVAVLQVGIFGSGIGLIAPLLGIFFLDQQLHESNPP